MKQQPIQSLWMGAALSPMEILCIRSYLACGHEFHLYIYDCVANIPEGTLVMDANEIIPKEQIYVDAFGGYVNLSNRFRYAMLYKIGGWWVDMDTVCLKPFDFDEDFIFSSETSDPYRRNLVNTTYIKSPPGAQFLKDCLDFLEWRGHDHIHWGELGVNLISRMIFRNGLGRFVRPPECFCPVSGYRLHQLTEATDESISESACAVHWWHELWRRREIDKAGQFPETSWYERLKRRYGVNELR
jgi:hypothetical protein